MAQELGPLAAFNEVMQLCAALQAVIDAGGEITRGPLGRAVARTQYGTGIYAEVQTGSILDLATALVQKPDMLSVESVT